MWDEESPAEESAGSSTGGVVTAGAATGAIVYAGSELGEGDLGGGGGTAPSPAPTPAPSSSSGLTPQQASRFLAQATTGATRKDINAVLASGIDSWLASQFGMLRGQSLFNWLNAQQDSTARGNYSGGTAYFLWDCAIWRQLITAPDQLRNRVALALLDIMVVGVSGLSKRFPRLAMAASL